jgi:hypothetical protein
MFHFRATDRLRGPVCTGETQALVKRPLDEGTELVRTPVRFHAEVIRYNENFNIYTA